MGNVHLVTGYAGREHITAVDQGSFNRLLMGEGQFVFGTGKQLEATIVSNNQIRIADGEIFMQGRYIRLNPGAYVDLTIGNGKQDYHRHDLIVARYTKETGTGVEDVNLVVIQGSAVTNNPSDPSYSIGDLTGGTAVLHNMPLYRVVLNGINIKEVVPLFSIEYVGNADKQAKTDKLEEGTELEDADFFPFYDASLATHKKVPWSRIKAEFADDGSVIPIERGGTGHTSVSDDVYTDARYRASALVETDTTPTTNGVINWTYK